jgi:hypothetical protein
MRDQDPEYYRKNNYKVIELLDNPSHDVVVIPETDKPEIRYTFIGESQKTQIKSTMLYTFCVSSPRAIVITCDHPNAINKDDSRLITLVNVIGFWPCIVTANGLINVSQSRESPRKHQLIDLAVMKGDKSQIC